MNVFFQLNENQVVTGVLVLNFQLGAKQILLTLRAPLISVIKGRIGEVFSLTFKYDMNAYRNIPTNKKYIIVDILFMLYFF